MNDQVDSTAVTVEHDQMTITAGGSRLTVAGELDMDCSVQLQEQLAGAGEPGSPLEVDMSSVTFIDSTAISALLKVRSTREIRIVHPSDIVRKVLELVGLRERFGLD